MVTIRSGRMTYRIASGKQAKSLFRQNLYLAKRISCGQMRTATMHRLRDLTANFGFSLALGDLQYLDGGWYVTHTGLLRLAHRTRCSGIGVQPVREFCDPSVGRWVFRATVYKSSGSRGFVGYGDADPSNVSSLVHGAEMRVAETRAVNRALRKAYGIGLCSVEELGSFTSAVAPARGKQNASHSERGNLAGNGQPRLRDRLCLLIRQQQLDPTLVKRYAADFCGTETLRDASRELVESFITHLAEWAARDREGLLCKLNGYAQSEEAKS